MADEAEAPKPDPKPEGDDRRKREEFFVNAPLRAAVGLQKRLPIHEMGYRHVVGYAHADARAYFLYGSLDEVIKATVAGVRWLGLLGDEEDSAKPEGPETPEEAHIGRLVFESVIDEQEMWGRKLSEILFDLVLFASTNEQEFYRLYLVCKQLDAYVGLQADFEEFFACRSANADRTIRLLLEQIEEIRQRVDLGKAWFVADGLDFRRPPAPGRLFRSARQRFMRAQASAPPDLRLVLRVSYEMGYSSPSRSVHPNVGGPTRYFTKAEVVRNLHRVGLVGLHVVVLAHQLAGIGPDGETKQLADSIKRSDAPEMFRRAFQRELEVGDIVFAYGEDLCQIVDTAKSSYGNTSYKVRYLIRPMIDGIDEDWFPARYIRLLYRKRDIKPGMVEALRRGGASEEQIADLELLDEEEAARSLARTFVDLEQRGLLRMMLRPPKEERG